MDEIHIWQLKQDSIFIYLPDDLRKKLVSKARSRIAGSQNNFFRAIYEGATRRGLTRAVSYGTMHSVVFGRRPFPLWGLLEICRLASDSPSDDNPVSREMEKQILGYRDGERGKHMRGKFPIAVSPEFESLVGHFLGDGTFGGKYKTANYCQKSELGRKRFLEKLCNVFGGFEVNPRAYEDLHVLVPKPIVDLLRAYYGVAETDCLHRRLSEKIKSAPFQNRLAVLAAFIVDEGRVGDSIEMCVGNAPLLDDFKELAQGLGYRCSEVRRRPSHNSINPLFRFRISLKSAPKLLGDIAELSKRFPTCDLAQKQRPLEFIVSRQALQNPKTPSGLTKRKIIELIGRGANTTAALKENLVLSGSTISEHLRSLSENGSIRQVGKVRDAHVWAVA
ncbi:hypothetical protein COU36_01530 [Candidatus Micrarchaeota archaeon CG10_big_fil_rev_8_21_14_0_10_59_7]|nr:MAG: hypothetical protein COU36_01530 [Candidatus Micrarchaeota archaeon CG10_big_fil_rev_8_21_14_0_10_59_7]